MRKGYFSLAKMAILTTTWFVLGCNQVNKRKPGFNLEMDIEQQAQISESISNIYHMFPSPSEMLSIIDMAELKFDEKLLNPVSRADSYLTTVSKTQMLGVYLTDLAYTALFSRHEATLDYLEVVRRFAWEIHIDEAVDEGMVERTKTNVEYLDSLYQMSNVAFLNILSYCEKNGRNNTVVMISAGAIVESMFLAVNLVEDYNEASQMIQHLADQKYTIDNFLAFAAQLKVDDLNVVNSLSALKRIKKIYDGIDPGSGKISMKSSPAANNNQQKKIVIGGAGHQSQPSLNEEEFEELKKAVIEIREKIITG